MRLHSTRESVENGEVSFLAIVETVLAMGASLFVVWHWHYTTHLIAGAFIAPLLLLRTKDSTERGLAHLTSIFNQEEINVDGKIAINNKDISQNKIAHIIINKFTLDSIIIRIIASVLGMIIIIIIGSAIFISALIVAMIASISLMMIPTVFISIACVLIKINATLRSAINFPSESAKSIAHNFYSAIACVDSTIAPEAIPGIETSNIQHIDFLRFNSMSKFVFDICEENARLGIILALIISVIYIPAISYRLSVKSTALFWLPLIWITRPLRKQENLLQAFTRIRHTAIHWVLRIISLAVVAGAALKLYLLLSMARIDEIWAGHPLAELFRSYVLPESWAVWQMAAVVNGALAWGLFFFADYFIPRVPPDHADLDSALVRNTYNLIAMLRTALTFYIIPCTIYIVTRATLDLSLPPLETKVFPWQ